MYLPMRIKYYFLSFVIAQDNYKLFKYFEKKKKKFKSMFGIQL